MESVLSFSDFIERTRIRDLVSIQSEKQRKTE